MAGARGARTSPGSADRTPFITFDLSCVRATRTPDPGQPAPAPDAVAVSHGSRLTPRPDRRPLFPCFRPKEALREEQACTAGDPAAPPIPLKRYGVTPVLRGKIGENHGAGRGSVVPACRASPAGLRPRARSACRHRRPTASDGVVDRVYPTTTCVLVAVTPGVPWIFSRTSRPSSSTVGCSTTTMRS